MKNRILISLFLILGFAIVLSGGCKKDEDTNNKAELAVLTTSTLSDISQVAASCGGNVTSDGGAGITARGVCWSTSSNPLVTDNYTIDGTGTGEFTSSVSGLAANTIYYIRAYATNSVGTAYGNEISFTTLQALATGQTFQGGLIAYIFKVGDPGYEAGQTHGLIAASVNQANTEWGCEGTIISGTGSAVGTGQSNTTAIIGVCQTVGIAARLCDELELNGYSDWFLPSKDELNYLYQNLHKQGIGNFTKFLYWSSSEVDGDNVWTQNFDGSLFVKGQQYSTGKFGNIPVRAVRNF